MSNDMTDAGTQLLSEENSETLQQLRQVNERRSRGESAPIEAAEAGVPAGATIEDADNIVEANPEAKVKIGDQEFSSHDEAFAYAQSLHERGETEKLINDAYRQGIQDAAQSDQFNQNVTQSAPAEPEEDLDAKFFENPTEYLKTMGSKIRAEAKAEALHEMQVKQAETNLWQEFYTRHPDLDGFQQDCDFTLEQFNDEVATLAKTQGKQKAMDYLAQKVRAKFQTYMARQRPQEEVQRAPAQPSPSGGQRVTQQSSEKGAVDFMSQLAEYKRSKHVRS